MSNINLTLHSRRWILGLSTSLATSCAVVLPAAAQLSESQPTPPSEYYVDANGVDLLAGQFYYPTTDVSIGSGENILSFTRMLRNGGYESQFDTSLNGGAGEFNVVIGSLSDHFTSASNGLSTMGTGAHLSTPSSGLYIYTARDGTRYQFEAAFMSTRVRVAQHRVTDITYPDGESIRIDYNINSSPSYHLTRPKSVQSNDGFRLTFTYQADWISGADSFSKWMTLASVTATNAAVGYCATGSCAGGRTTTYAWTADNLQETRTDSAGRGLVTTFDTSGRITAIKPLGASSNRYTITYSGSSVSAVQTPSGLWQYTYSAVSNPSSGNATRTVTVTSPTGLQRVITIAHYKRKVIADRTGTGGTMNYEYDSQNRLNKTIAPEGNAIAYQYDTRDNVTVATYLAKGGASSYSVSATYPATCTNPVSCNKPTSTTDARGFTTNYTYDPTHGQITSIKEPSPDGSSIRPEKRFTYTPRPATYYTSPTSTTTINVPMLTAVSECASGISSNCVGTAQETRMDISYPTSGMSNRQPSSVTVRAGNSSVSATQSFDYTDFGQIATIDGPLTGTADTTTYSYDVLGNLTETRLPDPDGAAARGSLATRLTRDVEGRVTDVQAGHYPNGNTSPSAFAIAQTQKTEYSATTALRVSDSLITGSTTVQKTQYAYDADARLTCETQRMNAAAFNSTANACVLGPQGTHGPDRIKRVEYDTAGRVKQITDGYGTTDASVESALTYTANGKLATLTDAENNRTTYEYDGQDRPLKARYPVTTKGAQSSSTTDYEQFGYDNAGNVINRRLRDGTGISYGYDNLNRLVSKNLPGTEPDATYSYDLAGRPLSATQGGKNFAFAYDALGRKTGETSEFGTIGRTYDAAGRPLALSYLGGVLTINYDYDTVGNVTKIRENGATSGVGVLAAYAFDDLGRRTSVTFGNGSVQNFGYDPVSRLSMLTNNLGGSATTHDLTQTFAYNPASQIASVTRSNDAYAWQAHYNVDRSYTINGLNRIMNVGSTAFTYDGRGNLTSDGTNSFTYTSENLLVTAPSGSYVGYDPMGRLRYTVAGGIGTTWFTYDGADMLVEHDPWGAPTRRYVHGPGVDNPIVWYEGSAINNSTRRFLMADEKGSIVSVADSAGATLNINAYDEYGIPAPGNIGRFGYTGQAWLPELGMWYYKARIYSPTLGRFMQTDPIGYQDGMNWYNYVGSDPVNFTDPRGLDTICNDSGGCWDPGFGEITTGGSGREIIVSSVTMGNYHGPSNSLRGLMDVMNYTGEDANGAQSRPCPTGGRITLGAGPAASGFLGAVGASVGGDINIAVPVESLTQGSLRGTQLYVSGNFTPMVGLGLFKGGGLNIQGGYSQDAITSGSDIQYVNQAGLAMGPGGEISFPAGLNFDDGSSSISAGLRGGLGLYSAVGWKMSRTVHIATFGC